MLSGIWKGLGKLTWVEIKVFLREPLGAFGAIGVPVIIFLLLGRLFGRRSGGARLEAFVSTDLPVLAAVLVSLASVLSLITIIAIYREGGILKRLRVTPLSPITILTSHVVVKLLITLGTLLLLMAAGKTWGVGRLEGSLPSFALALLFSTASIMSLGFLIASLVPTARFAQPLGSVILYPMLAISGLFFPIADLPRFWQAVAQAMPLTHAVTLLRNVWTGAGWLASWPSVAALALFSLVCTALAQRVFRWE